jgi:hypothetical protein
MTRNADLASRMFGRPMSPGAPVEGLRCGGQPSDQGLYRTPPPTPAQFGEAIREMAWEEKSWHGQWEDRTPRVRGLGGGDIVIPPRALPGARGPDGRWALALPRCEPCGREFISADMLTAHRQADHGEPVPGAPLCERCGAPMPVHASGPTARYCSGPCWTAAHQAAASEPGTAGDDA